MKISALFLGTTALAMMSVMPAHAQFVDRAWKASTGLNADHPTGLAITAMGECLAEKSDAKIKLTGYWSASLGDDVQATQALRSGTQEIVVASSSPIAGLVPALGVFDLPFLINDTSEADQLLDGEFGDYMSSLLEEHGLVNLAYWENGFRNLTNSKRAVEKWEDIDGLKVRVMQNNIYIDAFANMGANATPMAWSEVYSALETGAIDAQENPFVTIYNSKLYEVQDYLAVTRHSYTPNLVLFSKVIWDTLSADEQGSLVACAEEARDFQRSKSRAMEEEALAHLKELNMTITELSEEERARMVEQAQSVYQNHREAIGVEVNDRVQAALETIRSAN